MQDFVAALRWERIARSQEGLSFDFRRRIELRLRACRSDCLRLRFVRWRSGLEGDSLPFQFTIHGYADDA